MTNLTCTIDGCDKPSRNKNSTAMCKMHYHRWYRHGSPDMVATNTDITVSLGRRYKRASAKGHPLADANGLAYVHRVVLFDDIGPGPHACHWCGCEVDWVGKGDPRCLNVDHLNDDGSDNRIDNLVPSCATCNTTRGAQAKADALRAAGWWSHHDTIAALTNGRRDRVA